MITNIVVGADHSATAQQAAEAAVHLGRAVGARLHFVCAFPAGDDTPAGTSPRRTDAEQTLGALAHDRPGITTHALPGTPADAILTVAREVQADLIVVGSKGMHGARRLLGSVPNDVAHRAPCSVMIVRTT